jgi:sporulation protein YlmC with PRC-barrel domain
MLLSMIKHYSSIIGTPVLNFDDGSLLAVIEDIIVDPETGKIEAFWVKPLTLAISDAIIQSQDIVEWKKNVYVKNESFISDPAEIIKISEILAKKVYLIGNKVKNQKGKNYGKVYDLDFSCDTFYVRQIYARRSVFGIFKYESRIFSFDSIIEITDKAIIIDDETTKKREVIENAFIKDKPVNAVG